MPLSTSKSIRALEKISFKRKIIESVRQAGEGGGEGEEEEADCFKALSFIFKITSILSEVTQPYGL